MLSARVLRLALPLALSSCAMLAWALPGLAQDANEPKMLATGDFVSADVPGTHIQTYYVEFAPGAKIPNHSHGGTSQVLMISGTLDVTQADGTTMSYKAGDKFDEAKDGVHSGAVTSAEPVTLIWTLALPDGAEMETMH